MSDKIIVNYPQYSPRQSATSQKSNKNKIINKNKVLNIPPIQLKMEGTQTTGNSPIQLMVYLYLQPYVIYYSEPLDENVTYEIELKHAMHTITRLQESDNTNTCIDLNSFKKSRPSFSIPILQDNINHITNFADIPVSLILYETRQVSKNTDSENNEYKRSTVTRVPRTYGYIDLLHFFISNRTSSSIEVFLHPVLSNDLDHRTCKMTWHIYSLMPLLKSVHFSNCIFIAFTSIYNVDEDILSYGDHLIANLSFQLRNESSVANSPLESNNTENKILICQYRGFDKSIINEQNFNYKWESLKNSKIHNSDCIGINADITINLTRLFSKLMYPENCSINIEDIKCDEDWALVCNSLHRFVLTQDMHIALEQSMSDNKYVIVVDIVKDTEPNEILLQGILDPAVFMYPNVHSCPFIVELKKPVAKIVPIVSTPQSKNRTPARSSSTQTISNKISDDSSAMGKLTSSHPMNTFAIIKICLKEPITEPPRDLHLAYNVKKIERLLYKRCQTFREPMERTWSYEKYCQQCYLRFEDNIFELVYFIQQHDIQNVGNDRPLLCVQMQNMCNLLLQLISCDFNRRFETKNNIEFKNLMTIVFKELRERIYALLKNENIWIRCSVPSENIQEDIVQKMNIIKLLHEFGFYGDTQYFIDELENKYKCIEIYEYFKFLDHIEKGNYEIAQQYFLIPIHKELEEQYFVQLSKIYINYMQDISDPNESVVANALSKLIQHLTDYCENSNRSGYIGWLILHCIYNMYNYLPGKHYTRWQFDALTKETLHSLNNMPLSRWDIYNKFQPQLLNQRNQIYWHVITILLNIRLYQFAEWVYRELEAELTDIERYILNTSFMFHLNKLQNDFELKTFNEVQSPEEAAMVKQINANIKYHFNKKSLDAMKLYEDIVHIQNLNDLNPYQFSLLRYGYILLGQEKYKHALNVFEFINSRIEQCVLAHTGMGLALYFLNELVQAITCFSECTKYNVRLRKIWGYLAIINLKLNNNYEALECWKYYRLKSDYCVEQEILNELNKINYDDINLFVNYAE